MLTRPADLGDDDVVTVPRDGWGLDAEAVEYAPVGYGSYHWHAHGDGRAWFVTADDLALRRRQRSESLAVTRTRLEAALSTARSLRDSGVDFVVAPCPTRSGGATHPARERFLVALYAHVAGETHAWCAYPSRGERLAVLQRLSVLHAAPAAVRRTALVDDLLIPARDDLAVALTEAATRLGDRPDPVPDEVWDDAARHYDEVELASLVVAIASINVWNRLNVTTRQVVGQVAW